jgi:hypothetical protein
MIYGNLQSLFYSTNALGIVVDATTTYNDAEIDRPTVLNAIYDDCKRGSRLKLILARLHFLLDEVQKIHY